MNYDLLSFAESSSPISGVYSGYYLAYLRGLQRILHGEFEQVKAGVAFGAPPQITSDGRADRFAFLSGFAWVGC